MPEKNENKKNKTDSGARKIKRGAIMTGVVIGMGATFVLSSVISLFSKGAEKREQRKQKKTEKNSDKAD